MQCIKCGKPVAEGEIFCALCSLTPKEPKGKRLSSKKSINTAPAPKVPVKSQAKPKLADSLNPATPNKAYAPAKESKKRNFFPAFLVMLILAFGALSYIAMMYHQWTEISDLITDVEQELSLYREDIALLEGELAETEAALLEAEALYDNAVTTISALQAQLNTTENSVNQTQYDMTTQQMALEDVAAENSTLISTIATKEAEIATLTQEVAALTESAEDLTERNASLTTAYDFMNEFVVFVGDDGTNTYHLYGCENFNDSSFWAYNRSLAETYGNTACPICFP